MRSTGAAILGKNCGVRQLISVLAVAATMVALLLPAGACTKRPKKRPGMPVVVSILPQKHFVEKIGGEHVAVTVLVGPQDSPETFQISPRQLETLSGARLWLQVGMAFEDQLQKRIDEKFKDLVVVPTQKGVPLREMPKGLEDQPVSSGGQETAEGEAGGHVHEGHDPHIWLSPQLVKIQAANIAAALIKADPDHKDVYEANLAAFQAELEALDAELRRTLAPLAGRRMLVAHPAFGYFAQAYGLRQVSAEVEGKEPSPRQLAELEELAKKLGLRTLFVPPQFSQKLAAELSSRLGTKVVVVDPLPAGDYAAAMRQLAEQVVQALSQEQQPAAVEENTAPSEGT